MVHWLALKGNLVKTVHSVLHRTLGIVAPLVLLGLIVQFSATSVSALLNPTPTPCVGDLRVVPRSGSNVAPTFVPAGATPDLALATAAPCATGTSVWALPVVSPGTRIPLEKGVTSTAATPKPLSTRTPTLTTTTLPQDPLTPTSTPLPTRPSVTTLADWTPGDCFGFVAGDARWIVVKGQAVDLGDADYITGSDIEVRFSQGSPFLVADVAFYHKMSGGGWVTHYVSTDSTTRYYWSGGSGSYDWYYTGGIPFDPYQSTLHVTYIYQTNGTGYLRPRLCGHDILAAPTVTPTATSGPWSVGICTNYIYSDAHWVVVKGTPVNNGGDDYITGPDIQVQYNPGFVFKLAQITFTHAMTGGSWVTHYAQTEFYTMGYWSGGTGSYSWYPTQQNLYPYVLANYVSFVYQTNGTGSWKARVCVHGVPTPTPTLTPSPTATFTPTATATPTATLTPTPQPIYKINLIDDGNRPWHADEAQAINEGVVRVGQAFDLVSTNLNTPQTAFNTVMLENSGTEILFIRTTQANTVTINNYQYLYGNNAGQTATLTYNHPNIQVGYCVAIQESLSGTVRLPAAIICSGDLIDHYSGTQFTGRASVYTVIHELGHIFDYRTGNGLSGPIGGSFVLPDCSGETVMGPFQGPWRRGRRGWGTGPSHYLANGIPMPLITDFQENPDNSPIEAAADSFLNWVYRLTTSAAPAVDSCALSPTPAYNQWTGPGFLNLEWPTAASSFVANNAGLPGTPDPRLPGDTRYLDTDARIRQLFTTNGW
jgi:hypothetical protein